MPHYKKPIMRSDKLRVPTILFQYKPNDEGERKKMGEGPDGYLCLTMGNLW